MNRNIILILGCITYSTHSLQHIRTASNQFINASKAKTQHVAQQLSEIGNSLKQEALPYFHNAGLPQTIEQLQGVNISGMMPEARQALNTTQGQVKQLFNDSSDSVKNSFRTKMQTIQQTMVQQKQQVRENITKAIQALKKQTAEQAESVKTGGKKFVHTGFKKFKNGIHETTQKTRTIAHKTTKKIEDYGITALESLDKNITTSKEMAQLYADQGLENYIQIVPAASDFRLYSPSEVPDMLLPRDPRLSAQLSTMPQIIDQAEQYARFESPDFQMRGDVPYFDPNVSDLFIQPVAFESQNEELYGLDTPETDFELKESYPGELDPLETDYQRIQNLYRPNFRLSGSPYTPKVTKPTEVTLTPEQETRIATLQDVAVNSLDTNQALAAFAEYEALRSDSNPYADYYRNNLDLQPDVLPTPEKLFFSNQETYQKMQHEMELIKRAEKDKKRSTLTQRLKEGTAGFYNNDN